jgi:diadenylate cyclase
LAEFFSNLNFKSIIDYITTYTGFNNPIEIIRAVVDISIVAFVIYKVTMLVKETRAWQLLKGILVILVAALLSGFLGLKTIAFLLNNTIQYIAIALIVIFQPELRRGLEHIGRSNFKDIFSAGEERNLIKTTAMIEEIVKAATQMSETLTGALIVIERKTRLGEIINTGTELDSKLTCELLINIFTPNTPLHDGAVIIRSNMIKAASCFLPLTDNPNLSKELGTRHRAALGITEVSDSIAIVVSEETGQISFALNGGLSRNLNSDTLRKALNKNLLDKVTASKRITLWRVKDK